MAEKAVTYRRVEKITGLLGTAVNVVQMVFGNTGENSGTGVCFTRNPSTGERAFYGDYLVNAQGEDVVAGIRTPMHLTEMKKLMPKVYGQLEKFAKNWRSTIATCRTWSSPLKRASFICSRRAQASALLRPP